MRNAQNAALLAFMAEADRRQKAEQVERDNAPAWERVKRPILVDLSLLGRAFRRAA